MSPETEDRTRELARPERAKARPRVAIAIFVLLFSFVGLFVTALGLVAEDLYLLARDEAAALELDRPGGTLDHYLRRPDDRLGAKLSAELAQKAFGQVDPQPYLNSRLWRGLRLSMMIRGLALVIGLIGAVLLLQQRFIARSVLALVFSTLILVGATESILATRDGPMIFEEYRRDLANAFHAVTESVGISGRFPTMRSPIETPQPKLMQRLASIYFLLATFAWQILLLALVARPSTLEEVTPVEASPNSETPCADS